MNPVIQSHKQEYKQRAAAIYASASKMKEIAEESEIRKLKEVQREIKMIGIIKKRILK